MNHAKNYVAFFENLNKQIPRGDYIKFFDENSYFEDPFQKVKGIDKIYNIFEDMYVKLYNPRFIVHECISNENVSYIKWSFFYQMDKTSSENSFVGLSRVEFSSDGKVLEHVDFWDAGANVYEKIPFLGAIIRFIKRKLHA
jgi:hypothetical protein